MTRSEFFKKFGIGALICAVVPKILTNGSEETISIKGTEPAYELQLDKIKTFDSGIIYCHDTGIWLPVDDYIKLRQTGQLV